MKTITRKKVEKAHHELNEILGREQTPEQFHADVDARMARINTTTEKKAAKSVSANRSLFSQL